MMLHQFKQNHIHHCNSSMSNIDTSLSTKELIKLILFPHTISIYIKIDFNVK